MTGYTITPDMKVAVAGFGRAGQAVVRYLGHCGAELFVSDLRQMGELSNGETELLKNYSAHYEGGGHTYEFLSNAEIIVVSPGIAVEQTPLQELEDAGTPVLGELALAAGKFNVPVIAITGTNGKTTVTELVGSLLSDSGRKVFVGGNIGTPVIEFLLSPADYDVVVLEVSSFQLERCGSFEPDIAVLMNISPDHLDRHKTIEQYAEVKMRIFHGTDVDQAILNGDDRLCRQYKHLSRRDSFSFFGNDTEYAACTKGTGVTLQVPSGVAVYDLSESELGTVSGIMNSAAALLAVQSFHIDYRVALDTLRQFKPGDHRLQKIAEHSGVIYINDSKATNTGAVNIALEQVGSEVILIAGGKNKGDNYQLLREAVRNSVKYLVLVGETAPSLARDLGDLAPYVFARDMEEAVALAAAQALPGDTVLLSPACASFDMFRNYKDRGDCFIEAVDRTLMKQHA